MSYLRTDGVFIFRTSLLVNVLKKDDFRVLVFGALLSSSLPKWLRGGSQGSNIRFFLMISSFLMRM